MTENTSFPNRTLAKDLYEPSFNGRKSVSYYCNKDSILERNITSDLDTNSIEHFLKFQIRNDENNTFINVRDSPFLNDDFNQIDNPFLSSNFNKEKQSKSPTDSISTTSSIKSDLETMPRRRNFM